MAAAPGTIPVFVLAGYLGAGKTSLLNHLLKHSGTRLGVIINDFGDTNIDAGLVSGQVDEPASIAGGCLCCLPDAGGLDDALEKLAQPRLALDAIMVEASGIAEPAALARLIRGSRARRIRPGGVIEVLDAVEFFRTVDFGSQGGVASLLVLNKIDRLAEAERDASIARIEQRVRDRNPDAALVRAVRGRIDPQLILDPAGHPSPAQAELPIDEESAEVDHAHAAAVSIETGGPVDPGRLIDLLESPPPGAYRIKGVLSVREARGARRYLINLVGRSIHLARARTVGDHSGQLVAVGPQLDVDATRRALAVATEAIDTTPSTESTSRLQRHHRLSR